MATSDIQTRRLKLIPQTVQEVRAQIEAMDAAQKAELSPQWIARIDAGTADLWTLGFAMVDAATDGVIGTCGFKGPPGADGMVEIAYGVEPAYRGHGYATEAADALVAFAFAVDQVSVVRAHTLPEPNASTRVLARCGFRLLGEVIDSEDGLVWRWERRRP